MIKYEKKHTDKSFDIDQCRESAQSGYAPAQYQLGQCYEDGAVVEAIIAQDPFNINGIADYQIVEFMPSMFCDDILKTIL